LTAAAVAVLEASELGARVLFLDETTFTSQTIANKAWAHRDSSITISGKSLKCTRLNLIIAFSQDRDADDLMSSDKNLYSDFSMEFL